MNAPFSFAMNSQQEYKFKPVGHENHCMDSVLDWYKSKLI